MWVSYKKATSPLFKVVIPPGCTSSGKDFKGIKRKKKKKAGFSVSQSRSCCSVAMDPALCFPHAAPCGAFPPHTPILLLLGCSCAASNPAVSIFNPRAGRCMACEPGVFLKQACCLPSRQQWVLWLEVQTLTLLWVSSQLSFPVNFLCLECLWEMLFCFCLQQLRCFDFVWVVWKTVRHLEWVFCLLAIWLLHIYFSYLLHDDKGTQMA